jgi:flagellar basal-body rod protein FlgC
MDLFKMFAISGAGMSAQRSRMSVISGNLANAETTRTPEGGPYRRRDVVLQAVPLAGRFNDLLADTLDPDSLPVLGVEVSDIKPSDRVPRKNFDPNHPDADLDGYVRLPDINVMEEMVDMLSAVRSYEANLTAYSATKNLVRRLLEVGRGG